MGDILWRKRSQRPSQCLPLWQQPRPENHDIISETEHLAPTAHQIPVYLMVFSTFLCRAFTAQYLYTLRCNHIPPSCFTAQPTLGLLWPIRLFLRALAFRWGLPYLLPARLPIPPEVSRVHYRGLKQDDVGG